MKILNDFQIFIAVTERENTLAYWLGYMVVSLLYKANKIMTCLKSFLEELFLRLKEKCFFLSLQEMK